MAIMVHSYGHLQVSACHVSVQVLFNDSLSLSICIYIYIYIYIVNVLPKTIYSYCFALNPTRLNPDRKMDPRVLVCAQRDPGHILQQNNAVLCVRLL